MSKDEQHDHEMMVEAIHDKRHRDPRPDNPPPGPKWLETEPLPGSAFRGNP